MLSCGSRIERFTEIQKSVTVQICFSTGLRDSVLEYLLLVVLAGKVALVLTVCAEAVVHHILVAIDGLGRGSK
jgi:hypothetical protein